MLHDLRYAIRMIRRRPGFAAVAVLAIGIGIAFNTAVFSIANAVLLRTMPYEDVDRLMMLWQQDLPNDRDRITLSPAEFVDYRQSRSFEQMALIEPTNFSITGVEIPIAAEGARVTVNFFSMLGVRPALGRFFAPEEERNQVVVLGHGLWMRQFGGDPGILGATLSLEHGTTASLMGASQPAAGMFTVIGVLPPDLRMFYREPEIWIPLHLDRNVVREQRGGFVIGRLKEGVTVDQGTSEMKSIAGRLAAQYPRTNRGVSA